MRCHWIALVTPLLPVGLLIASVLVGISCTYLAGESAGGAGKTGLRIRPGKWGWGLNFEHVAHLSHPISGDAPICLDFPEAIFTKEAMLYLSHRSERLPVLFTDLPEVEWEKTEDGIRYERRLPNGVRFGGSVLRKDEHTAALELFLENGSEKPFTRVLFQVCAHMRKPPDFNEKTSERTSVHLPGLSWLSFDKAIEKDEHRREGLYKLGWRGWKPLADLPVTVIQSKDGTRIIAVTFFGDSFALWGNPKNPCIHADPLIGEVGPGERKAVRGEMFFFRGTLADFETYFRRTMQARGR